MSTHTIELESGIHGISRSGLRFVAAREHVKRIQIGPIGIDSYSEKALVSEIVDHALTGNTTRQVVTINAQFYVLADHSPSFRRCLARAEYACADGMPIVWACRRFARIDVPRIAGVDLIEKLCKQGATHGLRVFLLGGNPGTAQATAALLATRYPGLVVVGTTSPQMRFTRGASDRTSRDALLKQIKEAQPQMIFLGLGAPKQEIFADKYLRQLEVPIVMGVGGSFEMISGMTARAPRWMQTSGFEWLYRLAQEPRRMWRRYLIGNAEFLWSLATWRFEHMRGPGEDRQQGFPGGPEVEERRRVHS